MTTKTTEYQKMNPEDKLLWINALRSGEFKQSQRALKTKEGHCCLGVLCEVKNLPQRQILHSNKRAFTIGGADYSKNVPKNFCGLSYKAVFELISMNDEELKSFNEIADWIEENL